MLPLSSVLATATSHQSGTLVGGICLTLLTGGPFALAALHRKLSFSKIGRRVSARSHVAKRFVQSL